MDLGNKIKSARADSKLTQKDLAQKSGLTERTIQRIENHEVEPSVYSLKKISQVLQVDFNEEKTKIMKRRNRILYSILAIWTVALIINITLLPFEFSSRWWEILIWLLVLIGVMSREIYIPYRRRSS